MSIHNRDFCKPTTESNNNRLVDIMHLNELAVKDSRCLSVLKKAADKSRKIAEKNNIQVSKPLINL